MEVKCIGILVQSPYETIHCPYAQYKKTIPKEIPFTVYLLTIDE